MYKNFNITESEKEQILNRLKENGYGQPINEQQKSLYQPGDRSVARVQSNSNSLFIGKTVTLYSNQSDANQAYGSKKSISNSKGAIVCKITQVMSANNDGVRLQAIPLNEVLGSETTLQGLSWKQADDVSYGGWHYDPNRTLGSDSGGDQQWISFMFNKNNETFTILDISHDMDEPTITSIPYYNYSLRDTLVNEFFQTDFAKNNKQDTPTDQIAEGKQVLIGTFKKLIK
jgi:hypothetical protein